MLYLKTSHHYSSLKMKYMQKLEQDFPALGQRRVEDDGFGHMIEDEPEDLDDDGEALEVDSGEPTDNTLKVDPTDFVYDENSDTITPLNLNDFDELVEKHPSVNKLRRGDKRDEKVAGLKAKVLQTLKVTERKRRSLSYDSIKSDCSGWGGDENGLERDLSSGSRGSIRKRSEEESNPGGAKKSLKKSKLILKPPKIVITKK